MFKSKLALAVLSMLVASGASAQSNEEKLRKIVEKRLTPGTKIVSIKLTPYAGLYEIRVPGDILYTDKTGEYIFIGNVMQASNGKNLTEERIAEITKINFSELPKSMALKMVKGNGKRVMAIFEDPNCGYCKRFRQTTLKQLDNVTVYTYMLNILSADSVTKSRDIWCSADRNKAWDDWMLDGKVAATAPAGCVTPNEQVSALGRQLRIDGTPALIFADGSRISGMAEVKRIEDQFAKIK